jgi:hypothetical protein
MSREKKSISSKSGPPLPQQMPIEQAAETELTEANSTESAKPIFRKYLVQCNYHTTGSIAYRIYAANESDAEHIGHLRFAEDGNRNRLLDSVKAVQVVSDY